MYNTLVDIHSFWRFVILLVISIQLINNLYSWISGREYMKKDHLLGLFVMVSFHIQLLLGVILYFISPLVQFNENTMKDEAVRYWTMEHLLMMLIAIVLVSLGYIKTKKDISGQKKHKRIFIYNFSAITLVILAIVFSGRGLFIF